MEIGTEMDDSCGLYTGAVVAAVAGADVFSLSVLEQPDWVKLNTVTKSIELIKGSVIFFTCFA
ncbi:hypothetical protein GCM10027293_01820 [Pontibacter aydingkolensis]